MNENERKLLFYLVDYCIKGKVKIGDPRTYISYSSALRDMGFPDDRRTPGDSLNEYAMGGLARWLHENSFPAITGLIVNKVYDLDANSILSKDKKREGLPSATYFTFHGKEPSDYQWHEEQVSKSCMFDWYEELESAGIIVEDTTNYADDVGESSGSLLEGKTRTITVNAYERNPKARSECIRHHGCACKVCNFNFAKVYGEKAEGYIHVHHLIPLSQIQGEYEVDPINDLIPVCPNCHAMLHRADTPSVDKLKEDIRFQEVLNA